MKESYQCFLKNLFTFSRSLLHVKKLGKALGFVVFFALMTQLVPAQTTISWTGLSSSDASLAVNWNPQLTPWTNILFVDSAKKYANLPILTVDTARIIRQITKNARSVLTINVAQGYTLNVNGASNQHFYAPGRTYFGGKGTVSVQRNIYLNIPNDSVFITDGILEARSALLMGNANVATTGGYMFISGTGRMHCRSFPFRFTYPDTTMSNIVITQDGQLTVIGDFTVIADSLANKTHQLRSTPDRDIVIKYDPSINTTKIYSRDKMAFLVEPGTNQNLMVTDTGTTLRIVKNNGLASMQTLTWKFSTTSGSGYTAFSTAQTGDTLFPIFATPGTFYVVCEGFDGTNTRYTNEIKFIVASNKISIEPSATQKLKLGQIPYPLTITEKEAATSREWFYTQNPGSDYVAFSPAQTGTEISPVFDTTGSFYVTCKSTIGGNVETAKEVEIIYTAKDLYSDIWWNGTYSSEASDIRNWNPHAYMFKNTLIIDSSKYDVEPVLTAPGRDTIGDLGIKAGASFTFNKSDNDTVVRTGDHYLAGHLIIKSGFYNLTSRLRLESNTPVVDVSGGGIICGVDFIVGTANGLSNGKINISGTGIVDAGTQFWRFPLDTTKDVITIWDDGKAIIHTAKKDSTENIINTWIQKTWVKTLKDWELVKNYNSNDSTWIISAFDPNAISLSPKTDQVLAVNEPASVISASNTVIYDSLIWKYSTSIDGALTAFEPQIHDTFAAPAFATPGNYYVVCIGMNDTITKKSNTVHILVPDVSVSPSAKQVMQLGGTGIQLTVTETPAPETRVWKAATTAGGPYTATTPSISNTVFSAQFAAAGVYFVICESDYNPKKINSNEVEIEVVDISISPTSNQTIEENTDGTTITASETGTVDSRQWKFSTTAGSGYVSFSPAESAVDYTPNFATAGTYYVICESVLSGLTVQSEEVRITVTPKTGTDNTHMNGFALYPNPSKGTFTCDGEDATSYRIEIYNAQGELILSREFKNVSQPQEINLESKGMFIVNLITQSEVKTSRLIIE